jgi:membrane protein DedA with SNARE-associated domain
MAHLSHFFLALVDHAGYGGLFVVMTLGNMGIPVGTEIVMPVAGALAAVGHLSSWWLAAIVGTCGEVAGGTALYAIGYAGGRPFVARWGGYVKLSEKKLDIFHAFYERHGNVVVFVCRFIPFVRGVSALPAGVSRMARGYFVAYTALGSAMFCFALAWLGSTFGRHIDDVTPLIHRSAMVALVILAVAALGFWLVWTLRARQNKASGAAPRR